MLDSGIFTKYGVQYTCEDCVEAGIKGVCAHRRHAVPDHLEQDGEVERVLFGDTERTARESLGVVAKVTDQFVFPHHQLDRLFSSPRVHLRDAQRFIFIAIDPCAGSDEVSNAMSDFCVVSVAHSSDTILGLEAIPAIRASDYEEKLFKHLERLRSPGPFEHATLVFDVEANGSIEWSRLESAIRGRFKGVVFMTDFKNKTGATNTNNRMKEECAKLTYEMLERGTLGIAAGLVTSSEEGGILREFERQMRVYERIRVPPKGPTTKATVRFSGKGANGKLKDDLAFTLQRALRSRGVFFTDASYARYRL